MASIVTVANKNNVMDQIIESITEEANTSYYLFAGKSTQYEDGDVTIETPIDDEDFINSVYKDMLFGKRVGDDDVKKVVARHDWESNTVYAQYDDTEDMFDENFFCMVDEGSYWHVYKCLYNNLGAASTIQPDFSAVSSNDSFYETSDGYRWKYMYTVDGYDVAKFASEDYFPVIANTEVEDSVVIGAIENYVVESVGSGYDNYLAGNNVFGANDRALNGNTKLFNISSNSSASSSNNFYNGCYIYIKDGNNNEAGQYRKIVDYVVNSSSKAIVLESAFANTIGIGATYDIYPGVLVVGDGTETVNAEARAIVNSSANSIHYIEILNVGARYKEATATIVVDTEIDVEEASIRPVKSPWNGHGWNAAVELGSENMCISVDFNKSESNTILIENDFRTIGLIVNPTFANVVITSSDIAGGSFTLGETVSKINPIRLGTNATVNTTSAVITDPNGDFVSQLDVGDTLFLSYQSSNTVANSSMLTTVASITNSSSLTIASNASFSALTGGVWYSLPRDIAVGTVIAANSSSVTLDGVTVEIEETDLIIGGSSGTLATVEEIFRSGVQKDFATFISANKYVGTATFGTFTEDETVSQASTNTSATFHSLVGDAYYMTGGYGEFSASNSTIVGQQSGAIATLTEKYGPEINFRSGNIIYIENIEPVSRANTQSETFKLIFKF